ncbi:hypothetical protein ATCC90586_003005 [Pythium insidiosum]|nr:hypothetical protein ATCC90586_003005 [Pythium insidiosum]
MTAPTARDVVRVEAATCTADDAPARDRLDYEHAMRLGDAVLRPRDLASHEEAPLYFAWQRLYAAGNATLATDWLDETEWEMAERKRARRESARASSYLRGSQDNDFYVRGSARMRGIRASMQVLRDAKVKTKREANAIKSRRHKAILKKIERELRNYQTPFMTPRVKILFKAAAESVAPLKITFFFLITVVMVFATALFYADPCYDLATCTFTDIFNAGYFVMVTVATVGYGNQVPSLYNETAVLISAVVMLFGSLYLAMPLAIVGIRIALFYAQTTPELQKTGHKSALCRRYIRDFCKRNQRGFFDQPGCFVLDAQGNPTTTPLLFDCSAGDTDPNCYGNAHNYGSDQFKWTCRDVFGAKGVQRVCNNRLCQSTLAFWFNMEPFWIYFEFFFNLLFIVEMIVHIYVHPCRKNVIKDLRFFVDVLILIPFFVELGQIISGTMPIYSRYFLEPLILYISV